MQRFSVMLDFSRNGVMKVEKVKEYIDYLKLFGYNSLMLYTEDTYEIEGEPYFGYLRGRYSKQELKEINEYCVQKGIELIPCIQTLGHLTTIFRWKRFEPVMDTYGILLAEEEQTYQLIDKMFSNLAECFTSKVIHIGMDEAHSVGLGRYLDKHGYKNRFEILKKHLERVIEIAKKYGFKPIMWSDMFFRLANEGVYYLKDPKVLPQEIISAVPDGVNLVYWNYYEPKERKAVYDNMLKAHKKLDSDCWFAGGIWTWRGFVPFNAWTREVSRPALDACKKHNIDNILFTLWGDNGSECSYFAVLSSLYYVKRYYEGEKRISVIKKEFKELTGEDFDKFNSLDLPNLIAGNTKRPFNPSKYGLYNDLFLGIYDGYIPDGCSDEYKKYAKRIKKYGKDSKFGYLFETSYRLCDFLADKIELGKLLRKAYQQDDKDKINELISVLKRARKKLEKLYTAVFNQWHTDYKPFGFEIIDQRFGGLAGRLKSCQRRLTDYLDGKGEISELEEVLLPIAPEGQQMLTVGYWEQIVRGGSNI